MDTDQLEAFIAVATHRSVSAAARSLGVSQSALSRLVQRLEHEVGASLLDRTRRPVVLTGAGEELLAFAQSVVDRWEEVRQRLQAQAQAVRGQLHVVASTIPGEFLVPPLLAEFTRRHPDVEPSVAILDTQAAVDALVSRHYDVGFIGAPLAAAHLTLVPVAEDEVVLAVPASHPFAQRKAIALEDLRGQPLILREGGSGTYQSLLRRLEERGLALPPHQVAMVLGSSQAIVSAVRAGLGMGFVSRLALAGHGDGGVCAVRIQGVDLRRSLYLAYHESRLASPLMRAFVEFVRERATPPR